MAKNDSSEKAKKPEATKPYEEMTGREKAKDLRDSLIEITKGTGFTVIDKDDPEREQDNEIIFEVNFVPGIGRGEKK